MNETPKEITYMILARLEAKYKVMYQMGLTKVFLRELLDQYLEQQLIQVIRKSALIIQKSLRMFVARRKYLKLRASVILIQSHVKTWIQRLQQQLFL
jgi:myosin heavy subunit